MTFLGKTLEGNAEIITLMHEDVHACNTFEAPNEVIPSSEIVALKPDCIVTVPAGGVVSIIIR